MKRKGPESHNEKHGWADPFKTIDGYPAIFDDNEPSHERA
jgi:hypothetical protein